MFLKKYYARVQKLSVVKNSRRVGFGGWGNKQMPTYAFSASHSKA